jgi:hypothetical protein
MNNLFVASFLFAQNLHKNAYHLLHIDKGTSKNFLIFHGNFQDSFLNKYTANV